MACSGNNSSARAYRDRHHLVGGLFSLRIPEERSWLTEAYQALDRGDFSGAGALFQRLADGADTRMKSQGYAGLAAVAFARRDYQQALGLVEQAERLDPEISYSHVLRGHVLWNQGKLAEAAAEYQLAVSKPRAIPWQQAIAHDRLGRIYAARGDAQNALDHYDKAIVSHQQMAAVHANKGHLLEQLGRRQEALALYRRALQVNPDDALTVVLLRDAEYREQLAQDRERQQRIDQLIAELVQAYREGRGSELPSDAWTSTPLSIAVLPIQPQGPPSPRAGREELALTTLVESLRASDRMTVVERAFLDQLLAELKLGSSILADPVGALRLGRILAARLTATGRLIRLGDTEQLSIRLIETETTRTVAAATEMLDAPENLDTPVKRLVQVILTRVRQQYPLQGRIVDVTPQGMTLNIGALQGVTPGLVMGVFREGVLDAPVGRVEVISVEAQSSRARVLEQSAAFQRDWQVREESQ